MAARRRPYGTLIDPVPFGLVVERASKDRLATIAKAAGVSSAVMLEHLIDSVDLTASGVPTTWKIEDGALPIDPA